MTAVLNAPVLHRSTGPWITEARALLSLAGPLAATQLAQMAVMTTDVILLGRFSKSALAAAAIGNTVYFFGWLMGGGPASAVSPMIAHHLGERPRARGGVRTALRMGLWAIAFTSAARAVRSASVLFAGVAASVVVMCLPGPPAEAGTSG